MEPKAAPPLFARIILGISALVTVGAVYWFVSQALEQAPMPNVPPPRSAQKFNPKADVSKNPVFAWLESKFMAPLPDLPMGRENPFVPIMQAGATGTIGGQPSTATKVQFVPVTEATTTTPIAPSPATGTTPGVMFVPVPGSTPEGIPGPLPIMPTSATTANPL
jgi:hypothetical protein